ncbi:MAG: hypothetical protein R3E93_12870 [Thiothrix sp.]
MKPWECPAFGKECNPQTPLGSVDGVAGRVVCGVLRIREAGKSKTYEESLYW